MTATARSSPKRAAILDAASRVVRRDGADALTLDAVAREAGVSKGGLLYHFPTKDALVAGIVANYVDAFDAEVARRAAAAPDRPGRWLRAYVDASFDDPIGPDATAAMGLLAAAAINPSLLDPVRASEAEWRRRLERDGIDPVRAAVVRLAVDGLTFAELFGLPPLDPDRRRQLRAELLRMTEETVR